jgi:hypothetical protein
MINGIHDQDIWHLLKYQIIINAFLIHSLTNLVYNVLRTRALTTVQ